MVEVRCLKSYDQEWSVPSLVYLLPMVFVFQCMCLIPNWRRPRKLPSGTIMHARASFLFFCQIILQQCHLRPILAWCTSPPILCHLYWCQQNHSSPHYCVWMEFMVQAVIWVFLWVLCWSPLDAQVPIIILIVICFHQLTLNSTAYFTARPWLAIPWSFAIPWISITLNLSLLKAVSLAVHPYLQTMPMSFYTPSPTSCFRGAPATALQQHSCWPVSPLHCPFLPRLSPFCLLKSGFHVACVGWLENQSSTWSQFLIGPMKHELHLPTVSSTMCSLWCIILITVSSFSCSWQHWFMPELQLILL
jgi:hypothetical protein